MDFDEVCPGQLQREGEKRGSEEEGNQDPYQAFVLVEQELGLDGAGTHKERCRRIWEELKSRWSTELEQEDFAGALKRSKKCLQWVADEVLAPRCRKSSRARWLVSLQFLLRLDCALLTVICYGTRHHINLLLRLAPVTIHMCAVFFHENNKEWSPEWEPMVTQYLGPLHPTAFPETLVLPRTEHSNSIRALGYPLLSTVSLLCPHLNPLTRRNLATRRQLVFTSAIVTVLDSVTRID